MADRYWVGGSGNWSDATNHWSDSSNGAPGAGFLPTSADDVFFDANSNTGTGAFTVTVDGTVSSPSICKSFATGGAGGALDGAMTVSMPATAYLDVYGSLTLPATNLTWTGTTGCYVTFRSTTTGNTYTTNGVTMSNTRVVFDGSGGEWTLGSALTLNQNSVLVLQVLTGTFITNNYNITSVVLASTGSNTRTITLGSSTVTLTGTLTPVNFTGTGLTFNAGTSQITCSSGTNPTTLVGNGNTFYNVSFTGTTTRLFATITGANTFNNLSITTPTAGIHELVLGANQTVNGTLTLGAANTAIRRCGARSDIVGTQRTLTVATLATLADVDFQDINAAGASAASPWSGTRIGDCGGNNNITFTAASDKYWYSATGAGGNWSAAQWETTAGGTSPSVNNFPLPQDTVKFQNTGLTTGNTITIDQSWNLPAIDGTSRTNAMTLASGTLVPTIFGDLTIVSAMTITGTGSWRFSKQGTQNVTTNGVTVTWPVNVENGTGSVKLTDNFTTSSGLTLTSGGLNLNDKTATCLTFSSSNSNTRSIAFGTGKIVATGNATTVIGVGILTNFSYTGTPIIESNYSGSTGTRTINFGQGGGATETNSMILKVSAGSDTVAITTGMSCKTLDVGGFSGTVSSGTKQIYADLVVGATTIWAASTVSITFGATSGTQNITTNGATIDQPIIVNAPGATVKLIDALTIGTTRIFTLTAGTLDLNGNDLSCGVFFSSGSTTRVIAFGTKKISITGNAGTVVSMNNMTNFSYTGTPTVQLTYSGGTGTRTVNQGASTGFSETNVMSIYVTAGTDTVAFGGSSVKTLDTTGFSGTLTSASIGTMYIYSNLVLSATTTWGASAGATQFRATSGTQSVTTNGVTINCPLSVICPGATVEAQDAITLGAYTFTQSAGTLKLKNGTTNTADAWSFAGTVSTPISLQSTTPGSRATISDASGTNNATYLTVKDIVATGGATFNAFTGAGSTTSNNNVNNGNNLGWYFIPPGATFMDFF